MSLKQVGVCMLFLCAFVAGLAIELMIAGVNIVYWSFATRGLWLLIWTGIAFVALYLISGLASHKNTKEGEENGV